MRKSLKIREMELGSGRPKICVPITGKAQEDVLKEAELAKQAGADLIEWRADYYQDVMDIEKTVEMAEALRKCVGDMPILFTYRTEGCEDFISLEDYVALNERMAIEKAVDIIDVELFMGDEVCRKLCELAHANECIVIISSHDFEGTPGETKIIERLRKMRTLGADIPKIAVMPHNAEDVLTLLSATTHYAEQYAEGPLITMSMKWLGGISRVSGEIFGSALSFGSTLRVSAPGQLSVADLKYILNVLHSRED